MKAVLISIQPKWCELIASGQKTVEVRKTKPKLETPFKCYIYCTQGKLKDLGIIGDEIYQKRMKVIGEFVCDGIITAKMGCYCKIPPILSQVDALDLMDYADGKPVYGWHITDLVIYDKPRELSEFEKPCVCKGEYEGEEYCDCLNCELAGDSDYGIIACDRKIKRPPESWFYVERSNENGE